jgi:osmotically inducible protein OsmC
MTEAIYTAHATATGGRHGQAETDDGTLKFSLASPGTAEAKAGTTNPEQLFACAYAACFGSALEFAAKQQGFTLVKPEVQADISLNKSEDGFFIGATLNVALPGMEKDQAEKLAQAAHQICPYSKATRGNIDVVLNVSVQPLQAAA